MPASRNRRHALRGRRVSRCWCRSTAGAKVRRCSCSIRVSALCTVTRPSPWRCGIVIRSRVLSAVPCWALVARCRSGTIWLRNTPSNCCRSTPKGFSTWRDGRSAATWRWMSRPGWSSVGGRWLSSAGSMRRHRSGSKRSGTRSGRRRRQSRTYPWARCGWNCSVSCFRSGPSISNGPGHRSAPPRRTMSSAGRVALRPGRRRTP